MFQSKQLSWGLLAFLMFLFGLIGCSKEDWSRGLPKSVPHLVSQSESRLETALQLHKSERQAVAEIASKIDKSLSTTLNSIGQNASADKLRPNFDSLLEEFQDLEGKLSVTSRAAYGELSGQLRTFISLNNAKDRISYGPFGLFSARTKFFLADELEVPAPKF